MVNIKISTLQPQDKHIGTATRTNNDSKYLFALLESVMNKNYDHILQQDIMHLNLLMRRGLKNKNTIKELKRICADAFKGQIYVVDCHKNGFLWHYLQPTFVTDATQPYSLDTGENNVVDALIAIFLKLNRNICPTVKDDVGTIIKTLQIPLLQSRTYLRYVNLENVLFDTQVKNILLLSQLDKFFGGDDIDIDMKQLLLSLTQDYGAFYKIRFLYQQDVISMTDVKSVLSDMRHNQVLIQSFYKIIQQDPNILKFFVNSCGDDVQRIIYDSFEGFIPVEIFYYYFAQSLQTVSFKNFSHYRSKIGSDYFAKDGFLMTSEDDDDVKGVIQEYHCAIQKIIHEVVLQMEVWNIQDFSQSPQKDKDLYYLRCMMMSTVRIALGMASSNIISMMNYVLAQDSKWYETAFMYLVKIRKIISKNIRNEAEIARGDMSHYTAVHCKKFVVELLDKKRDMGKNPKVIKRILQHFDFDFIQFLHERNWIDDAIIIDVTESLSDHREKLTFQAIENIIDIIEKIKTDKNRIFKIIQQMYPIMSYAAQVENLKPTTKKSLRNIYHRLISVRETGQLTGVLSCEERNTILKQIVELKVYSYDSLREILSTIQHDPETGQPFSYFDIEKKSFRLAYLQYITLRHRVWRRNKNENNVMAINTIEDRNVKIMNQIIYGQFIDVEKRLIRDLQEIFYQNFETLALEMQGFSSDDSNIVKKKIAWVLLSCECMDVSAYIKLYLLVRTMTEDEEDLYEDGRIREIDIMQNLFLLHEKINFMQSHNSARAKTVAKVDSFIFRLILYCYTSGKEGIVCPRNDEHIQYYPAEALKDVMQYYVEHRQQNITLAKTLININYENPLISLTSCILYQNNINIADGVGGSYSVLFYSMMEDRRINHDGIDQEGLLKHLIQACIDQIHDMKLFEEDEDGFLFIRRTRGPKRRRPEKNMRSRMKSIYQDVGLFIAFLLTQQHEVSFKLKDELLHYISANECITPYQDFYFDYDSTSAQAIANIDDKDEYDEIAREQHYMKYYLGRFSHEESPLLEGSSPHEDDLFPYEDDLQKLREGFQYFKTKFSLPSLCYQEVKRKLSSVNTCIDYANIKRRLRFSFDEKDDGIIIVESQENNVEGSTQEEIQQSYNRVKEIFIQTLEGLTLDQLVSFVKLACGTIYGTRTITVRYAHKNILPTWSTCHNRVTVGKTFTKEQLMLSLEHAGAGFFAV